jgi:hypothetical protein
VRRPAVAETLRSSQACPPFTGQIAVKPNELFRQHCRVRLSHPKQSSKSRSPPNSPPLIHLTLATAPPNPAKPCVSLESPRLA